MITIDEKYKFDFLPMTLSQTIDKTGTMKRLTDQKVYLSSLLQSRMHSIAEADPAKAIEKLFF